MQRSDGFLFKMGSRIDLEYGVLMQSRSHGISDVTSSGQESDLDHCLWIDAANTESGT